MKFRDDMNEQMFLDWASTLPKPCDEIALRIRPDTLYRMSSTGHRVYPLSYGEDGTVRVAVTGRFNCLAFEREVFGVNPNDLTECDLPEEGEQLGTFADFLESFAETHQ